MCLWQLYSIANESSSQNCEILTGFNVTRFLVVGPFYLLTATSTSVSLYTLITYMAWCIWDGVSNHAGFYFFLVFYIHMELYALPIHLMRDA